MKNIKQILNDSENTVINGIKYRNNNDNSVNNVNIGKYALDKSKFIPRTEEALLAEKISNELKDLRNFACYLKVVNTIGAMDAERLLRVVLSDIKEKKDTKYPVRHSGKYFMYKYKFGKY
ncbi:hypothetical protein A3E69_03605 [Candidatus Roizmanbacteria bacterium RIFCSPHIGHO2_12_FULL_40_130]|nr:MAG: hypothetical protein A3C31_02160 [Candidatus Roizmanbacteria bacterium RIFCSPHIGHO2_02_FULL_40_53]OGK36294.1 MAG: hypothetical protein A3E69_03605 [Candidatus Roizmanbacteria bacterium RIFCSPHIGHO2_12_FULL_40_130]